jgi:cyclopropane-fatty-acyl-phospholipid synthase
MIFEHKISNWADSVRETANVPLRIVMWSGREFNLGTQQEPLVTMRVNSAAAVQYLLEPNLDNLGEGYVKGGIDLEGRLSDIIDVAYQLASRVVEVSGGSSGALTRLRRYFTHTKKADEEAIQFHYDVSNEFYKLWLDENMVYSCAYFENGDEDLGTAQLKKIDHILRKIQVQPGQRLLDIGCGWGALVLRAAQKFGAQCVGVTLSQNQFDLATERVKAAGLSDKIEIRLQDYRDVEGQFDRITSVGMFEHVGRKNLPGYFRKIHELLVEDGIVMNHGITTTDPDNSPSVVGGQNFIDRYVFPGGELPHLGHAVKAMQEGGLETLDIECLRPHYVRTLNHWAESFEARSDEVRNHVNDERFRVWRVYLAGFAHAFSIGDVSIYQVVCHKAGKKPAAIPWLSRRHMYRDQL